MTTKERTKPEGIPRWWLDKAIPLLNSPTFEPADIAERASAHAGRQMPWDKSAISKFKVGIGRTVALTNGISRALDIPPPFFTAPTEQAAIEMRKISNRELALLAADRAASDEELRQSHAAKTSHGVVSSSYGGSVGRGVLPKRARRRGP